MARSERNRAHLVGLLLTAGGATAAFGVALVLGWEPGVPGEWVWERNRLPAHLLPAVFAALLLVGAVAAMCRPGYWARLRAASRALWMAGLIMLVVALQWTLLSAVGPLLVSWLGPGYIIASPNATTYFSVSLDVKDVGEWVRSYPEHMPDLPYHARTHPPGFVLSFLLARKACAAIVREPGPLLEHAAALYNDELGLGLAPSDAAAAIASALGMALLGALSLVPLYLLARDLVGRGGAACGAALMGAVPSLLLFAASPDLIILTLTVAVAWLGYSAWRNGSAARAFLVGLVTALGCFFSLSFAVVALWLAVWALLGVLRSGDRRGAARRVAAGAGAAACGFLLFYAALHFIWGYRPVAVAQQAFSAHRAVTLGEGHRTYWKWILMDPVEMVLFAGLPLVVLAISSWRAVLREPELARARLFLIAWAVVLVGLNLSGTVRGEVGRIWLFLLWPLPVLIGGWLARRPGAALVVPLLVLLQVGQALVMRSYLTIYSIK